MNSPLGTGSSPSAALSWVDVSPTRLHQLRQAVQVLRRAGEKDLADALAAWADQLAAGRAKERRHELCQTEYWLG